MHLGTNAIRLDDGRLVAILHVLHGGSQWIYHKYVYVMAAQHPHQVIGIGKRPLVLSTGNARLRSSGAPTFSFALSLCRLPGNKVVVGYNVNDETLSLLVLTLDELLKDVQLAAPNNAV